MKIISSAIQTIVESRDIDIFFLVKINLDTEYRFTSAPFDVTMYNNGTPIIYTDDGGLTSVEPPRHSATIDRAAYKIIFSDPNFDFRSYLEKGVTGSRVEVYVGFFNTTDNDIIGSNNNIFPPGSYFNDFRDTISAYKGVIDTYVYSVDTSLGEVSLAIEASSPMADLDLVRPFYASKGTLEQYDSTDTSFDLIFDGSGQIKLKWGKI